MPLADRLRPVPVVGTAVRVQERYRTLAADQSAASTGFVAFLALFPLVLVAAAVAGQVGRTNELYGVFGGVVALLLLFYLAGRIYLHGAVLSTVPGDGDGDVAPSGGLPPAPLPEVGRGTARFPRDPERPRIVAGPGEPSPVVTPATRARLDAAEERRPRGADVRGALAFVIAVGAVGGLVRYLRPWDTD